MRNALFSVASFGAAAVFFAVPAQANPNTSQSVIDGAATQICQVLNTNPTQDGVSAVVAGLRQHGFDDNDVTYALIAAVHHVCPQNEQALMGVITPIAQGEMCKP